MALQARIIALNLLEKIGCFRLASISSRSQIRILAYHRFGAQYITPQVFERQIGYLKKHYNVIDLPSYFNFLKGKAALLTYSVLITVDDGYQDFYTVAFPIIKKYAVPATVFLTADFIDKGIWLWHDLLNFGLKYTPIKSFSLNGRVFDLSDYSGKINLKLHLDKECTEVAPTERDALINQVLKELRVNVPEHPTSEYAPLTWNQILEMSRHGISFGSHTCSHPILSKLPVQEALFEIRESKKQIEEVTQREILSFCYPNGKEGDFNEEIKVMVKEAGFACAMSLIYGMNDLNSDPYELRRMAVDGRSFIYFIHDISGFGVTRKSIGKLKIPVFGGQE